MVFGSISFDWLRRAKVISVLTIVTSVDGITAIMLHTLYLSCAYQDNFTMLYTLYLSCVYQDNFTMLYTLKGGDP